MSGKFCPYQGHIIIPPDLDLKDCNATSQIARASMFSTLNLLPCLFLTSHKFQRYLRPTLIKYTQDYLMFEWRVDGVGGDCFWLFKETDDTKSLTFESSTTIVNPIYICLTCILWLQKLSKLWVIIIQWNKKNFTDIIKCKCTAPRKITFTRKFNYKVRQKIKCWK